MKLKTVESVWQFLNMSYGFIGIQFVFFLQNANLNRIFATLGVSFEDIPNFWIAVGLFWLVFYSIYFLNLLLTIYLRKNGLPGELNKSEEGKQQSSKSENLGSLLPRFILNGFICLIAGLSGSILIWVMGWERGLYILSTGFVVLGLVFLIAAWYIRQGMVHNGFVEVITDLMNMPKIRKYLAIFQFFLWSVLFVVWIYYTFIKSILFW